MKDEKYNGWTNRETWAVRLWIDNERESHFHWREATRAVLKQEQRDMSCGVLARKLEEAFDEATPQLKQGLFADLLSTAMGRVDWHEIAQSMLDDEDEASPPEPDSDFVVIYSYTRAQAIADGVLVDVSKQAQKVGFKLPIAMTSASWEKCVSIPEGVICQDESGRLWDVLCVLLFSSNAPRYKGGPSEIHFTVCVRNNNEASEDIKLKALVSPGDDGERVVTIMLPNED